MARISLLEIERANSVRLKARLRVANRKLRQARFELEAGCRSVISTAARDIGFVIAEVDAPDMRKQRVIKGLMNIQANLATAQVAVTPAKARR